MSDQQERAVELASKREAKSDATTEANIIRKAMLGEISFTSRPVVMSVGKGAGAAAAGVTLSRYFLRQDYAFPDTNADGATDDMAKTKRGGAKLLIAFVGAGLLAKAFPASPSIPIGFAFGVAADGVADILQDTVEESLDSYFGDEEEAAPAATTGTAGGAAWYRGGRVANGRY